jgi:hypothetical protein
MKRKKIVHLKNEKILRDEDSDLRKITKEDLRRSARKTEQSTMMRSTKSGSITFVEME